jgi:hypothetical protein
LHRGRLAILATGSTEPAASKSAASVALSAAKAPVLSWKDDYATRTSPSGSRPDGYPQQHKAARVEHHRGSLCVCTRLTMELTHVSYWLSTFPNRLLGPSSQSGTAYSLGL